MIHNATRVAYNVTSYTVQEAGLYVLLCSYSMTTGGTATKIYTKTDYNNTRTFYWANVGETITASSSSYNKIVYISGYDEPPVIELLADGSPTTTYTAEVDHVYLATVAGNSNSPSTLNYSFSCPNAEMVIVPWDDTWGDWSRTACALIEPTEEATITATMNAGGSNDKHAYIYEIKELVKIRPQNTGQVLQSISGDTRTLMAVADGGFAFDKWELEDYTRLDYIESSGTQWIDTGYKGNINTKIVAKCKAISLSTNSTINPFGDITSTSSAISVLLPINSTSARTNRFGNKSFTTTISHSLDTEYVVEIDKTNLKVNGTIINTFNTTSSFTTTNNIALFRATGTNSAYYDGISQIEYTRIYESGILIHNFVPVKKNSTNELGFLDLVEMKFCANQGTGTFTYGQELGTITFNDNPLTISASATSTLIANFIATYQITLDYDSSLGTANYTWVSGNQIELVATPNSSGQFKGWYINSVPISTNSTYTYTVTGDVTIEARFERVYDITDSVSGNGSIAYTRGADKNDVTFSVIADTNNHFVKYEVNGVEYTTTSLTLHLTEAITIIAYFEENDRYHITVNSDFPYGSFYISDNDVFEGTVVTIWARPFPDYNFVKWQDGELANPRQITVTSDITLVAEYQRTFETNGIYQYRCYIKDQLDLEALPKAFMVVDTFEISTDLLTNATSSIKVMDVFSDVDEGDVLVLYDPMGTTLYTGVINSIEDKTINCSQMQSFYKGTWIYNVNPQSTLEEEIALLLQDYADGKLYRSNYVDPLVAQRLGGITIDFDGTTTVNLPTDLDEDGNEQMTTYDMEEFIYELYQKYSIKFDFEINVSGTNYVHIRVPSFEKIKVGNNMYAIQNMSPITEIEETNKLVVFAQDKTYRTTYIATKNEIVEQPATTANRFNITNTEVVFSDDPIEDLIASNLPSQMFNHKVTFTLIIRNFIYEFGDFNLGGELDIYNNDDYFNSVLTGYNISKQSNQNIVQVGFVCGKVRTALTKMLTLGKV